MHQKSPGIEWDSTLAIFAGKTKTQNVAHYTYDDAQHCIVHAIERFGRTALDNETAVDTSRNPVGACFMWSLCVKSSPCPECQRKG